MSGPATRYYDHRFNVITKEEFMKRYEEDLVKKAPSLEEALAQGGVKHDDGKPELALISPDFIEELGKVMTVGAKKYGAQNWRRGFNWTRVLSAIFRHLFSWSSGQDVDPETGLSHLAHAAAGIMFLVEFQKRNVGTDDRYKHVG